MKLKTENTKEKSLKPKAGSLKWSINGQGSSQTDHEREEKNYQYQE